ncbi:MAG TPA: hypothetical protein VGM33_09730 [Baekduia sp.]|jgi:hypothetical protein
MNLRRWPATLGSLAALAVSALLLLGIATSVAHADAQVRASLSWDTDATDIDLHVWDVDGYHAWYGDRDGIGDAELSADITQGFGPENFEDFLSEDARTYTYGLCYFASNRSDGTVPDTVATVTVTDPDGTVRNFRRRLRAEGDAFLLGSSPGDDGSAYVPADPSWCLGATSVHPPADDGGVGQAGDGGGSPGSTFAGCERTRRRVGAVEVCADQIAAAGDSYTMSGNVRLNGSVGVDGPVTLDPDAQTVTSAGPVMLSEQRPGLTIPVAAGVLSVDAKPVKDSVSGRDNLATVDLAAPQPQAFTVAGLDVTLSTLTGGKLQMYLDGRDGGGLIATARVGLPLPIKQASQADVSIGIHGSSAAPVRLLGGDVQFGDFDLGGGWRISALKLAYSQADDTWTASGGFATPAFGLDVSGSLVKGKLDAFGVSVSHDVPIGTTGFILSSVGGSVSGLATPPLKIALTASGRWGSVPGVPQVSLIYLKGVTLAISFDGKLTLGGNVSFIKADGSPVNGSLHLQTALSPLAASGSLKADLSFLGVDLSTDATVKMNTKHFTASGKATGQLRGLTLGSAQGVVSEAGAGGFGQVCVGAFGKCAKTVTLGFGMEWKKFPSWPDWIGSDLSRYVTVSRARKSTIQVEPGRPLLMVDAIGTTGVPVIHLRSPDGTNYVSTRTRRDAIPVTDPVNRYAGLTILAPAPGRWTVTKIDGGGSARVRAQTVRKIQRVTPRRVTPRSTSRKRLKRKGGALRVRWTSAGLPSGTKVDVYVSSTPDDVGTLVAHNRRVRGSYALRRRALAHGANYVHLLVVRNRIAIDRRNVPGAIWLK